MLKMFTKLYSFGHAKMLESSINTYTIIDTKISVSRMYVLLFCLSHPYWNIKQTKWVGTLSRVTL